MPTGDESDDELIMLEYILDGSQSNPITNRRETHYKICNRIKQDKVEWKVALLPT